MVDEIGYDNDPDREFDSERLGSGDEDSVCVGVELCE